MFSVYYSVQYRNDDLCILQYTTQEWCSLYATVYNTGMMISVCYSVQHRNDDLCILQYIIQEWWSLYAIVYSTEVTTSFFMSQVQGAEVNLLEFVPQNQWVSNLQTLVDHTAEEYKFLRTLDLLQNVITTNFVQIVSNLPITWKVIPTLFNFKEQTYLWTC